MSIPISITMELDFRVQIEDYTYRHGMYPEQTNIEINQISLFDEKNVELACPSWLKEKIVAQLLDNNFGELERAMGEESEDWMGDPPDYSD